jgi:hypothetical protein
MGLLYLYLIYVNTNTEVGTTKKYEDSILIKTNTM